MTPSGHKAFLVNNTRDVDILLMHNRTYAAEYVYSHPGRAEFAGAGSANALAGSPTPCRHARGSRSSTGPSSWVSRSPTLRPGLPRRRKGFHSSGAARISSGLGVVSLRRQPSFVYAHLTTKNEHQFHRLAFSPILVTLYAEAHAPEGLAAGRRGVHCGSDSRIAALDGMISAFCPKISSRCGHADSACFDALVARYVTNASTRRAAQAKIMLSIAIALSHARLGSHGRGAGM